ncbi:hypothetical protein ACROYT_G041913 [Oculina patagonica]
MVFSPVIAGFHALVNAIGLPVNLLLIVTIALERRFHVMRYILLASLAVSDFLFLILGNSFRIASIAKEKWLYGPTMCYVNALSLRYFYLNTVLHLIAVSYERYIAIVKSPMTYDGSITKSRVVLMILIWVAPIPLSIGPFVGWGQYVYNPDLFFCEQGWTVQSDSTAKRTVILAIITLVVPSMIKVFLNWSVLKTANTLQHNPVGLCNPIIYSIRKKEFRAGVKNVLRRIRVCGSSIISQNNVVGMSNFTSRANCGTGDSTGKETAAQATRDHDERFYGSTGRSKMSFQKSRLSPIEEITD